MCEVIKKLKPNILVLGGIGILEEKIINIPQVGVLNSHPGLLPWLRGTGVVARAIERGFPIGGTCHFVNSKIDTGDIVERRLLPVENRVYSLTELELKTDLLAAEVMADTIYNIIRENKTPRRYAQNQRFNICKWMSLEERSELEISLKSKRPTNLFKNWLKYCVDQKTYRLENDINPEII
jgi:methionyl-tRNA formyltransferase